MFKSFIKKVLPVGIGLLLIIVITVTISVVKSATDRTPTIKDADKIYAKYGDFEITNDRLYTLMKNNYGLQELLNMVDNKLYAEEVEALNKKIADTESDEYAEFLKFIYKQVFGNEDINEVDEEDAQKSWDNVISSLELSALLTKAQASDSDYKNQDSEVWKVVKDYYKMPYARKEWAKKTYIEKTKEARGDGLIFNLTKGEDEKNSTNSIEYYFEQNYTGSVVGLFIPFTSQKAAYAMMNKYGINTNSNVITHDGWVKSSYDYYSTKDIEKDDELTYEEVVLAFFNMYNDVYRYLNEGNSIITPESYTKVLNDSLTADRAKEALKNVVSEMGNFGTEVNLPSTVNITNGDDEKTAKVVWIINNADFATINDENNKITPKFTEQEKDTITVSVTCRVTYGSEQSEFTTDFVFKASYDDQDNIISEPSTVSVATAEAFYSINFTDEFLSQDSEYFKFSWTKSEATEINSKIADYLSVDSTKLQIIDDEAKLFKSYTITPVSAGNYYYLILKLADNKQAELFEKDVDKNIVKDENGKAQIANQELYDEIVNKKIEELLSDNAINEMIYENRFNHNVKIYDSYIEALYEYEYKTFYETTLSLTDYNKFKKTSKTKKDVILTYQSEAGKKKSLVKITVEELFASLEKKYAMSTVATLAENYMLISNTIYNNIYNPYANKKNRILNKTDYKLLMNSEISTLRKNFESDYFTYSYLSYYGFTPNFPAKYGWKKFIKDYFNAYSDEELLTSSTYGGTIYSDALTAYTDSLYSYTDILSKMNEELEKYFSVSTINLIISTDYNYNNDDSSSSSASILLEEKDNWTDTQKELAKELGKFMYNVANQTNESTITNQMNALVTLYKEAAYEYNETEWNEALESGKSVYEYNYFGKYKLQGLQVKFESAANYDASSSIYEEYADECRVLYNEAVKLGLLDKTFDTPLVSKEAIKTDYGYHMIAILSATGPKDLPTEEEIEIYRAQLFVTNAESKIESAQKNIETYSKSGYNVSSYEAEKQFAENQKAKYVEKLNAVLAKYSKAEDYKLDEEATARIEAWYTNAESEIETGTLVTESYIKTFNENLSQITFTAETGKERFQRLLEILAEQCAKENE